MIWRAVPKYGICQYGLATYAIPLEYTYVASTDTNFWFSTVF